MWSNNYTWEVNVWSSHDWDMSDDLLICQGCFRAGQRYVVGSSTRIVTTRKMSRENSDPWHILSRYDDHSTSINNWSREHLCKIWVYQAYISLFKETHVAIKKDLKVYEQLEKKKKTLTRSKKDRQITFDILLHLKKWAAYRISFVRKWSVTYRYSEKQTSQTNGRTTQEYQYFQEQIQTLITAIF